MKTSSYDECEGSDVDQASVSDVNKVAETETDMNVIFKKMNPVGYFVAESNVSESQSNEAYVSDTGSTSAHCEGTDAYVTNTQTDATPNQSETHVFNVERDVNSSYNQTYLQNTKSESETNRENNKNTSNTDTKDESPEENIVQNEYRNIGILSPEDVPKIESNNERWSDSTSQTYGSGQAEDGETIPSDTEPVLAQCEPVSEYYTASSEVSLLSDVDPPEKTQTEDEEKEVKGDKKEGVIAGHVAAMRERFESMTRTNTPCPDLIRSLSPSLEVFRHTSPSPDRLA